MFYPVMRPPMLNTTLLSLLLACSGGDPAGPAEPAVEVDPFAAPDNVAAAPADATTTASGIAYVVLSEGTSTDPGPSASDMVEVHYTGWQTDGTMFDSSRKKGEPATFPLNGVIKGWTEGVQLMTIGDSYRFWIPSDLAYGNMPGRPSGMLVFDIELLDITRAPEVPGLTAPEGALATADGITYTLAGDASGDPAGLNDQVTFEFSVWDAKGELQATSAFKGRPAERKVNELMPGWISAFQVLSQGQTGTFWIPEELTQDPRGRMAEGGLITELKLTGVARAPETPKDVAKPPRAAKKTDSGLRYMVLNPGTGADHPGATSKVTVHYSGWTTDGKLFDSSVMRGEPSSFGLNQVIAGWTEGLQLMVPGETTRFWIPEELAYGGRPGKPAGMLVFDVELISID